MKAYNIFLITIAALTGVSIARAESSPLPKQTLGNVIFSVSDSNELIHVQMPFKVELDLVEQDGVPASAKYALSIYGEWDSNLKRPEIVELTGRYPGFKIANESQSVAVRDCKITLGDGTRVGCNVPDGTGTFFNALTPLSESVGGRLKAEIALKRIPKIEVMVSYLEPWATNAIAVKMKPTEDCKGLEDETGKVTVRSVIRGLVGLIPRFGLVKSGDVSRAITKVMATCLDPSDVRLIGSSVDLSTLLATGLRLKDSLPASKTLKLEELTWKSASGLAPLDVQTSVK